MRPVLRWFAPAVTVAGLLFLAACTEDGAGPEFASDPRPTRYATPTTSSATPAPLPTVTVAATPISLETMLMSRGAPDGVYFAAQGGVWWLDTNGTGAQVLSPSADVQVTSISASPGNAEVAILLRTRESAAMQSEVVIVDREGNVRRPRGGETGKATPVAGVHDQVTAVHWSPQGDRLLVAERDGLVFSIPLDEAVRPEELAVDAASGVLQPTWAPTGDRIAYIAAEGKRLRALRVSDTKTGRTTEVVSPSEQRAVVEFAWAPDGASLLFTESGTAVGSVSGVDLWQVDADGSDRHLVASAGSVAPVARITTIKPSPDGRAVAYQVLVPGPNGPQVDSVWVRDLATSQGFRLNLPAVDRVEDIWWTSAGLLVLADMAGRGEGDSSQSALFRVGASGEAELLWSPPVPVSTPVRDERQATPTEQ